ncbi:MAG: hypothetical protein Q4D81_00135 [Eubacteriales bacterium]|nr:hypothetical protein [Eubacteriales bacterium]
MMPEIGSSFWMDPAVGIRAGTGEGNGSPLTLSGFGISGSDEVFLSTGRAAQGMALDEIRRRNPAAGRRALLPPFTCHTVVEPFLARGYEIFPCPVDDSLRTAPEALRDAVEVSGADVVLLHRYFGFETLAGCGGVVESLRGKGVVFLEDRTQSLFSGWPALPADYIVGSLRKWAGMPDGGYVFCREGLFPEKPDVYDEALTAAAIRASAAKYEYIFHARGEKQAMLDLFAEAENILDSENGVYRISPVSERAFRALDRTALIKRRRANYRVIYEGVRGLPWIRPITGALTDRDVPLYCPLWVKDRAALQSSLREHRIYAPVVWPRPETLPPVCGAAEEIYSHILCIPVDQRYGEDDMERIVRHITEQDQE